MSTRSKRQLNFELHLVPFIDILSVSISFLLITTVFIQLGSMDVKQALGDESPTLGKNPPSAIVKLEENGDLAFSIKDVNSPSKKLRNGIVRGVNNNVNFQKAAQYIAAIRAQYPELQTALILPAQSSKYLVLIRLMDEFRKNSIANIGIAPL